MSNPVADPPAATFPDPVAFPPSADADPGWAVAARAWLAQSDAKFARRFDAGEPAAEAQEAWPIAPPSTVA